MIKVINFTIKALLTLICFPMWWLNLLIVIIMWDGKFMMVHQLVDLIWGKPNQSPN
jgi:hypothetical protein